MSRWFRHYAGMARDDKLVRVAIRSGQPIERVVWVYAAILESAAEIDDGGRYDFDRSEAAYFLRASEDDVGAVEAELAGAGRIASGSVVKWGDRQFQSDRSAARQAAYRERQRGARDNDKRHQNVSVTSQSQRSDAPETETETETEVTILKDSSRALPRCPIGVSSDVWSDFKRQRKKPLTATALAGLIREAGKAGITLNDALTICCERSWQSFKSDWDWRGNNGSYRSGTAPVDGFALALRRADEATREADSWRSDDHR